MATRGCRGDLGTPFGVTGRGEAPGALDPMPMDRCDSVGRTCAELTQTFCDPPLVWRDLAIQGLLGPFVALLLRGARPSSYSRRSRGPNPTRRHQRTSHSHWPVAAH
jgi:hypothetical protein